MGLIHVALPLAGLGPLVALRTPVRTEEFADDSSDADVVLVRLVIEGDLVEGDTLAEELLLIFNSPAY